MKNSFQDEKELPVLEMDFLNAHQLLMDTGLEHSEVPYLELGQSLRYTKAHF